MIKNCMKTEVVTITATTTIRAAALLVAERHVGLLPVVNQEGALVGVIGLRDLLSLEMPDFFSLVNNLDFISDFGAVETTRPKAAQIDRPVSALMRQAITVPEDCGMLYAYGQMIKHNLTDLPVVSPGGQLVGVVSRVDIAAAILEEWKNIK